MGIRKKYCIVFALLFWGCHNPSNSSDTNGTATASATTNNPTKVNATPLVAGMTDTVVCANDPSQKYAVYVPSNYDSKKHYPIIYFFDPHGVGNLPLRIYKDLADKYGYILAGTYNSKNGMQWPQSEKAAQSMMQDSWNRLSIDNSRMYVFGFSGGARVACSYALYDGGVAGVIACGGAFPERNPAFKTQFSFFGFAGERDFNYVEMKEVDKQLDQTQIPHQLVVYHGKHQWPPADMAEQAFQWLEVNAMKTKLIPKNDSLIEAVKEQFVAEASKEEKHKDAIGAYLTYRKMINFIGDMTDLTDYAKKVGDMQKTDAIKNYKDNEVNNLESEMQVQQQYINNLSNKDIDWWTSDIGKMRASLKHDSLSPEATEKERLLSYLSLATYMGAIQSFKAKNSGAMAHFLELYKLVDPTNPEHSYLFAYIYARSNNPDKAISNLQDAVKLGFTDAKRMENDSNFVDIKDKPAFKDLVKKIENAPAKMDLTQ